MNKLSETDLLAMDAVSARWNSRDYANTPVDELIANRCEWPFSGDHLYP